MKGLSFGYVMWNWGQNGWRQGSLFKQQSVPTVLSVSPFMGAVQLQG